MRLGELACAAVLLCGCSGSEPDEGNGSGGAADMGGAPSSSGGQEASGGSKPDQEPETGGTSTGGSESTGGTGGTSTGGAPTGGAEQTGGSSTGGEESTGGSGGGTSGTGGEPPVDWIVEGGTCDGRQAVKAREGECLWIHGRFYLNTLENGCETVNPQVSTCVVLSQDGSGSEYAAALKASEDAPDPSWPYEVDRYVLADYGDKCPKSCF